MQRRTLLFFLLVFANLLGHAPCAHAHSLHSEQETVIQNQEEMVYFNVQTHKYHRMDCVWARKCTVNCIAITREEAVRRGGVACKVCGGVRDL